MDQSAPADSKPAAFKEEVGLLLAMLLVADGVFLLLHVYWLRTQTNPLLSIQCDRSYAELFQYLKEIWLVLLLVVTAWRSGMKGYLAWALVFVYMLLDDALMVHEKLGAAVAQSMSMHGVMGLRPQDMGELLVTCSFGLLLLIPLSVCMWRSPPAFYRASLHLMLLVLCIASFGVAVDMVHVMVGKQTILYPILGMLEDGGEMIVMTFVVAYAWLLVTGSGQPVDRPVNILCSSLEQVVRR